MSADALRRIEADMHALVEKADAEHPIDVFELGVLARRIGAQAEMIEEGVSE